MVKSTEWNKRLKIDPIHILMEKAPAPVRFLTAYRFFPQDEALQDRMYQDLVKFKPRERLLGTQLSDGTWKLTEKFTIEEHAKGMQFLLQLKNLYALLNMGCSIDMPGIQHGLIALLKMQKSDGKFPLLFHHSGLALMLLVKFGLAGNPFVERSYRWISKRQREDGGWLSASMVPSDVTVKTAESGIWTTMVILQALGIHSRLRSSLTCLEAAEFILKNYLASNPSTLFPEPDAWNYLYTDYTDNGLFRGGTLRFIESLAPLAEYHGRPQFRKAIEWLLEQQLPNGLWPAVVGVSRNGDFDVTLRVITALKEIEYAKAEPIKLQKSEVA